MYTTSEGLLERAQAKTKADDDEQRSLCATPRTALARTASEETAPAPTPGPEGTRCVSIQARYSYSTITKSTITSPML